MQRSFWFHSSLHLCGLRGLKRKRKPSTFLVPVDCGWVGILRSAHAPDRVNCSSLTIGFNAHFSVVCPPPTLDVLMSRCTLFPEPVLQWRVRLATVGELVVHISKLFILVSTTSFCIPSPALMLPPLRSSLFPNVRDLEGTIHCQN